MSLNLLAFEVCKFAKKLLFLRTTQAKEMMMLCRTFFFFFFAVVQACHPPDQTVVFHVEWPWLILEVFESQSETLTDLCCLPNPNHARSWGSAGSATSSCTSAYPKHKHLTNLLHDLWAYKQIFGLLGSDCFFASRPITRHTSLLEAVISKLFLSSVFAKNHNLTPYYLRGPCLAPSLAPHPPPHRSVAPPSRAPAPGRQSLVSASGRTARHVSNGTRRRHRTKNETVGQATDFAPNHLRKDFFVIFEGTDFAHWFCRAILRHQHVHDPSVASALDAADFQVRIGKVKEERKLRTLRFSHMSQIVTAFPALFSQFRTKSLVIYDPICAGCVKTGMLKLYGTLAFYRIHFPWILTPQTNLRLFELEQRPAKYGFLALGTYGRSVFFAKLCILYLYQKFMTYFQRFQSAFCARNSLNHLDFTWIPVCSISPSPSSDSTSVDASLRTEALKPSAASAASLVVSWVSERSPVRCHSRRHWRTARCSSASCCKIFGHFLFFVSSKTWQFFQLTTHNSPTWYLNHKILQDSTLLQGRRGNLWSPSNTSGVYFKRQRETNTVKTKKHKVLNVETPARYNSLIVIAQSLCAIAPFSVCHWSEAFDATPFPLHL